MKRPFPPRSALHLCLYMCMAVLLSSCIPLGHDAEHYAKWAAEINARHAPLVAQDPENAERYSAWAKDLREVVFRASTQKFGEADVTAIRMQIRDLYAKAFALAPQNAKYALNLAHARIDLAERQGDAQALSDARAAFVQAKKLAPKNTLLVEIWAEALENLASDPASPVKDSLALLHEADAAYAEILPYAPMAGPRATIPYFWRARGRTAVLIACLQPDRAAVEAGLALAQGYYLRTCGEESAPSTCISEWFYALDPEKTGLADPSYAGILLRARLVPLLILERSREPITRVYTMMDLCRTYEQLSGHTPDPDERRAVLLEGKAWCERALQGAHKDNKPGLREVIKRIDAKLGAASK